MDVVDVGAAIAQTKKKILPAATAADAGSQLVVGSDGTWQKGEATNATISVSGTTLTITTGGE